MPTNSERIDRAEEVINEYRNRWDRGEPWSDTLTDLIADLMHWCHFRGDKNANDELTWPTIEARAAGHFEAELMEESAE
jgi:hypothetical protein